MVSQEEFLEEMTTAMSGESPMSKGDYIINHAMRHTTGSVSVYSSRQTVTYEDGEVVSVEVHDPDGEDDDFHVVQQGDKQYLCCDDHHYIDPAALEMVLRRCGQRLAQSLCDLTADFSDDFIESLDEVRRASSPGHKVQKELDRLRSLIGETDFGLPSTIMDLEPKSHKFGRPNSPKKPRAKSPKAKSARMDQLTKAHAKRRKKAKRGRQSRRKQRG